MKNIIKIIDIILLIVCMIVIFFFSSENANKSTIRSVNTSKEVINVVTNNSVEEEELNSITHDYFNVFRKSAHFIEYFILGLLVINVIKDYYKVSFKYIVIAIILCFIYSVSDEIHQIYVLGRSCQIKDMFIDTIGSSVGVCLYYFIIKIIGFI